MNIGLTPMEMKLSDLITSQNATAPKPSMQDMSMAGIARTLGRSDSYIRSCIAQNRRASIDNAVAMLDACGYDLVAIPKRTRPPNALKVDAVE